MCVYLNWTSVQRSRNKEMLLKKYVVQRKRANFNQAVANAAEATANAAEATANAAEDNHVNEIHQKIKITRLHIFTFIICYVYKYAISSLQKH